MGKLSKAVIDVDDDEFEDEDLAELDEDAETDEDDDDPEEDSDEVWAEYLPTILEAIRDGKLDLYLKDIGYEARERFMALPENGAYARSQAPMKKTARGVVSMDNAAMPMLGRNGVTLPAVKYSVGATGSMPTGSFRVKSTGHAYSKDAFTGRLFEVRSDVKYRNGKVVKAGSVMKVKECGTAKFICVMVEDETGRAPAREQTWQMTYDYNVYLFEGGSK